MRALYTCIWMLLILLSSRFVQAAEPGNTPEQLIRELSAAASRGDTNAFLAGLTGESRRSIDDWIRANQALKTDRDALREAMDQRFGPGRPIPTSPAPDFATALKKIHSLELIHASPQNPNTIMLSVKTTLDVTGAEITASETTFVAKQENGVWLLELTPGPPINVDAEHRAIVSVLEGVRRGDFHD